MAPALSVTPGEAHTFDAAEETDKPITHRRRALASVDNLAIPMEEDDMGLQNQPSLAKDSQEMEQILVDLGSSDLAQVDLLQAIKTFDSGGDGLSTGDADAIFPLSGFDLTETTESESDAAEDRVRTMQVRLERRCAFLQRRLRILQAKTIGKRVSEEAAQSFDKCIKGARKEAVGRPVGFKAFLKRIETMSTLQASASSRSVIGPKYYRTGNSKVDASKSNSVGIASGTLAGLEDTAGALRSHLSVVRHELDSDATASSSGAESNDEAVTYNNPHQQQMPIEKRALWSYQKSRSSVASRWCWLQAQIQELEYKIRQHTELHKQVREAKGAVQFEGEPVGYEGSLPGTSDDGETCARVRPLRRDTFKKRKLLQMHNLHLATSKAAKPSDIRCSCEYKVESCGVCTGRAEPLQPAPPASTLPPAVRVARVVPGYHPVLSDAQDIPESVHVSALVSRSWFRPRAGPGRPRGAHHAALPRAHAPAPAQPPSRLHKKHPTPLVGGGSGHYHALTLKLKHSRPAGSTRNTPRVSNCSTNTRSVHVSALVSRSWFRPRAGPGRPRGAHHAALPRAHAQAPAQPPSRLHKKHPTRLKRGRPPLSRKIRERDREDDTSVSSERGRGRPSTESRTRRASYDIDNIVIPQSVAAATRPQILTYKEIITPKWRVLEIPEVPLNNGVSKSDRYSVESDDEDVSEAAVAARHVRAEQRERSRYARKPRRRHAPDAPEAAPEPPPTQPEPVPPPPQTPHETVRPYSPRRFPLPDAAYQAMVACMPDGHLPPAPDSPQPELPPDEDTSSLSPLSVSPYGGDDPDDAEWEPALEKNAFR